MIFNQHKSNCALAQQTPISNIRTNSIGKRPSIELMHSSIVDIAGDALIDIEVPLVPSLNCL